MVASALPVLEFNTLGCRCMQHLVSCSLPSLAEFSLVHTCIVGLVHCPWPMACVAVVEIGGRHDCHLWRFLPDGRPMASLKSKSGPRSVILLGMAKAMKTCQMLDSRTAHARLRDSIPGL